MKHTWKSAIKKADKAFQIEKALRQLHKKSFEYYCLAVETQKSNEVLLEQNKRLIEENKMLRWL